MIVHGKAWRRRILTFPFNFSNKNFKVVGSLETACCGAVRDQHA